MGAVVGATDTVKSPAAKFAVTPGQLPKCVFLTIIFIGCLILHIPPAFGQMNTAEIAGQVKDPSGASIAGAAVLATQTATRQKYNAAANETGLFLFPQLPLGEYANGRQAGRRRAAPRFR